jgi:hypothetical protein
METMQLMTESSKEATDYKKESRGILGRNLKSTVTDMGCPGLGREKVSNRVMPPHWQYVLSLLIQRSI